LASQKHVVKLFEFYCNNGGRDVWCKGDLPVYQAARNHEKQLEEEIAGALAPPPVVVTPPPVGTERNHEFEVFLSWVAGVAGLPRELTPIVEHDETLREDACALATIRNGRRIIKYRSARPGCDYTYTIPEPGEALANWKTVWELCHELGHHAGEPKDSDGLASQEGANEWAGFAMARMKAPEEGLRIAREEVRRRGWDEGGEVHVSAFDRGVKRGKGDAAPPPPSVTQAPPPFKWYKQSDFEPAKPEPSTDTRSTWQKFKDRVKAITLVVVAGLIGVGLLISALRTTNEARDRVVGVVVERKKK
jgi:hypothetical protein